MIDVVLYALIAGNATAAALNAYLSLPVFFGRVSEIVRQLANSLQHDEGWEHWNGCWTNENLNLGFYLAGNKECV